MIVGLAVANDWTMIWAAFFDAALNRRIWTVTPQYRQLGGCCLGKGHSAAPISRLRIGSLFGPNKRQRCNLLHPRAQGIPIEVSSLCISLRQRPSGFLLIFAVRVDSDSYNFKENSRRPGKHDPVLEGRRKLRIWVVSGASEPYRFVDPGGGRARILHNCGDGIRLSGTDLIRTIILLAATASGIVGGAGVVCVKRRSPFWHA